MRRAVLDPNVLISALITPEGPPARLLTLAHGARFELVVSPLLLKELERVLQRRKFRRYVTVEEARDYLEFIRRLAILAPDPDEPAPISSCDRGDEYLLALAFAQKAILVSGDSDLLDLSGGTPICAPADFLSS